MVALRRDNCRDSLQASRLPRENAKRSATMSPKTPATVTEKHEMFLKIREILTTYVNFPDPVYADICALWAMATHVYRRFDSFGYLVITASTKRAGKSVLAECLGFVSHSSKVGTSRTAAVMRTLVSKGHTMFFDEAESLNSEAASTIREYLNVGYRAGQTIDVNVAFGETAEVPAYGPKCFILIGDVNDTLRDRSININLVRNVRGDAKTYRYSLAKAHGEIIQGATDSDNGDSDLTHTIDRLYTGTIFDANEIDDPIAQELLGGREAEVWTPIFSLAQEFCPQRFDAILACAATLSSAKQTHEKRRFTEIRATEEGKRTDDTFTRFAMMDLARVFKSGETSLYTDEAIERMRAIPTSPWRAYRDAEGLTPSRLSDLVSVFGVNTKSIKTYERDARGKIVKERGKHKQIVKRGFSHADVLAGLKRLGE